MEGSERVRCISRVRVSHDTMSRAESKRHFDRSPRASEARFKCRGRTRNAVPERQLARALERRVKIGKCPDFPHNSCSLELNTEMSGRAGIDPPRGRPARHRRLETTGGVRDHDALREGGVGRMPPVLSLPAGRESE